MFIVNETGRIATKLMLCFCFVLIFIFGMLSFYEMVRRDEPVFLVEGRQIDTREMSWIISREEAADYIIGIYEDQKMAGIDVTRDNYLMEALRQALVNKKENEPAIEAYANWIEQSSNVLSSDPISQELWQSVFPERPFPVLSISDMRFLFMFCVFIPMVFLCGFGICLFFPKRIRKFKCRFPRVLLGGGRDFSSFLRKKDFSRFLRKKTWLERNLGNLVDFPENTTRKPKRFR
jgi:hypothetical protein